MSGGRESLWMLTHLEVTKVTWFEPCRDRDRAVFRRKPPE
jgi:hypothetical protein